MKTFRDFLLNEYRDAEAPLDKLRERVLAAEFAAAKNTAGPKPWWPWRWASAIPLKLWNELVWPARQLWAGFAVVWMLIGFVDFLEREPRGVSQPVMAAASPQAYLTWQREQEMFLVELQNAAAPPANAPPPPPVQPKTAEAAESKRKTWA